MRPSVRTLSCLALAALAPAAVSHAATVPAPASDDPRITVAERSGFVRTGRYDEVVALCDAFATRHPDLVRCVDFGTTPEGRPMKALVAGRGDVRNPEAARASGRPVVLVQGGIHAGEIDGKDAGFLALRELLDGSAGRGVLDRVVFVFVPVFNVDGHERFSAWNRPNQRGPEEMGWRVTAQNLNLNRDYVKADAPEMQAMLRLIQAWDPIVYVDLHATDGAQFEHDISIQVEPVHAGDAPLARAGRAFRDGVVADLRKAGSLPLVFYPSFVVDDDPASGFVDNVATPRFSHGYMFLRNRMGMLVETHSWKPYPERVRTTRNTILSVLGHAARDGRRWLAVAHDADRRAAALAGRPVPLSWKATDRVRTVDFRGYAYTRTPSDISGALMTRYDETRPQVWKLPLRDELVPDLQIAAPRAGYLVPRAQVDQVKPWLDRHGIVSRTLSSPLPLANVEVFQAQAAQLAATQVEGHQRTTLTGDWEARTEDVAAGALFVPIAQPNARLVMSILEPRAPDSIAAWGTLNAYFERKEYMEDYVAEDVAREQLAADPALQAAFDRRVREDAAFAADPRARLEFFHRRHASWDQRHLRYPVLRLAVVPQ